MRGLDHVRHTHAQLHACVSASLNQKTPPNYYVSYWRGPHKRRTDIEIDATRIARPYRRDPNAYERNPLTIIVIVRAGRGVAGSTAAAAAAAVQREDRILAQSREHGDDALANVCVCN